MYILKHLIKSISCQVGITITQIPTYLLGYQKTYVTCLSSYIQWPKPSGLADIEFLQYHATLEFLIIIYQMSNKILLDIQQSRIFGRLYKIHSPNVIREIVSYVEYQQYNASYVEYALYIHYYRGIWKIFMNRLEFLKHEKKQYIYTQ